MRKKLNFFIAFFIPFLILIFIFYLKDVLKYADTLFVSDLRMQHFAFFAFLKNVLIGKASIQYSFLAGMGNPMLATVIFYTISPINILLVLFKDIRYAIMFILIIKISLSSLTMYIYLSHKSKKGNILTIAFATSYALSSYVIGYFFCIFWLDTIYLAPLVLLGIDKIIEKEKVSLLYIFSLSGAIMCNIQMGFELCIFSVIYFIYSVNIKYNYKKNIKKIKKLLLIFIISSLCVGGISSWALLGFLSEYNRIAIARNIRTNNIVGTSNIKYILKEIFSVGNYKSDYYNNYQPYIYSGLVTTYFSILYFFDKKINIKKKISGIIVILVFIISFFIKPINLFWHLSKPILLNFRYSIYLVLFLIYLSYSYCISNYKFKKREIIITSFILVIGFIISSIYSNNIYFKITFVFLIVDFIFILLYKYYNKIYILKYLLSLTMIIELAFSTYISLYTSTDLPYDTYINYKSFINIVNKNNFDKGYRVMYNYSYTDYSTDSLIANNNSSLRYFSSVINGNINTFFEKNYAFVGDNNYRLSAYESPVLLSLLGNKYIYDIYDYRNTLYRKINTYHIKRYDYINHENKEDTVYLYENPYSLSLGYMIEKDIAYIENMDILDYQNGIIKGFTGIEDDVLERIDFNEINDSSSCNDSDYSSCREYYLKNNSNNNNFYVYASISKYAILSTDNANAYLDVNFPLFIQTPERELNLRIEYSGDLDSSKFEAFTYNYEKFVKAINKLKENMVYDININKNKLTGKINAKKDGKLFFTIPYEKRFKIYVDNKLVKHYKVLDDTFTGIYIKKGKHNVKIVYQDNRIYLYLFITIISIGITFLVWYLSDKKNKKKRKKILNIIKKDELIIKDYIEKHDKSCYLIITCIILLIFGYMYSYKILNITNTDWIFIQKNDLIQNYVGWKAYRSSNWMFPIGLTNTLSYPINISIIYTDSIPILALIFKTISGILPKNFQYFGLYGLICFILNGLLSTKIIKKYTNSKVIILITSLLFIFIPTLLFRMYYHTSLSSHYLIILSLSTIFLYNEYNNKKIYLIWGLVAFLSSTIHIYFIPMCGIVLIGYIILDILNRKKIKRSIILLFEYLSISLLFIWLFGSFVNFTNNDSYGFGHFSFNLNGLIDPQGWSIFIKSLPTIPGQYEGFSYLGLGVIILLIIAIIITIKWFIEDKTILKKYKNLIISISIILLLSIFISLSPKAYIGNHLLYNLKLPKSLYDIWGTFRSTGRFIWPVIYIVMLTSIIIIIKRLNHKHILIVLSLCTLIQIIDLNNQINGTHNYYNNIFKYKYIMNNKYLNIIKKQQKVKYLIFTNKKIKDEEIVIYSDWAIDNKIKTNYFIFARNGFNTILDKNTNKNLDNINEEKIYIFTNKKECNKYNLYCYKLPNKYYLGYINELDKKK